MKTNIRNNKIRMDNAHCFSDEYIRAEANIGNGLSCMFKIWAEIASEHKNKNDRNHFAKYVLTEIESFAEILKEVKK